MFGASIHDRTTSSFPLSISTGLAMESLFEPRTQVYDPQRQPPVKVNVANYDQFWVNMATLCRNMQSASDAEVVLSSSYYELAKALESEMEVIKSLFKEEGGGACSVHFYRVDYDKVFVMQHHSIKKRAHSSAHAADMAHLFENAMDQVAKDTGEFKVSSPDLKPLIPNRVLMLTHYPYDLLSADNFKQLHLLESNTGALKTMKQWNTKYYPVPGADMTVLPFMKTLLMVLGDKALIHPGIIKLRKLIMQTSVKRNWTPYTTRAKVITDLEIEIKEPYVLAVLRAIR